MDPKKTLIISIILGVVAVGILQVQARRGKARTATIYKATSARKAGETLAGAYKAEDVPFDYFQSMRSQLPTPAMESFVSTSPLVRPIQPGATVTFDYFAKSADRGVGARIEPGMRAMAVPVNAPQSVGFLIQPGDTVDVLGTFQADMSEMKKRLGEDAAFYGDSVMVSKLLLQKRKVLAVGQQYRVDDSRFADSSSYDTITLQVTPDEAQKLEVVTPLLQNGFTIVLRNPEDQELVPNNKPISVHSENFDTIGNR